MLNIDEIQNGIVIDHIKAGTAIGLMDLLGIAGNRTASVALIQNARSKKTASGRKDIIKVEGDASWLNLDVLAYLDPNISVTIIENGKAVRKEQPKPPKRLVNIVRCKNPRCISSIEEECDQIFELSSNGKYRCSSLWVRLQCTALVPGQKICQPVQNCAQRQAGGSVLIPVAPACAAAKVAFHRDLCAGAGILRDGANIVRPGTLSQLLHKALGAGSIQPILPAVGAEVGLAQQAVGTGRKTPGQLPVRIVAQLPALAEQLEIQAAPPHGGIAHKGVLLPGQLFYFKIGIIAASVLQTDGEQQLCTGVQSGHGVVHGVKITGIVHD